MQAHLGTIVCKFGRDRVVCGSSSDLRKKVYRHTDVRTDGRRTPRDCISSWNELKTKKKLRKQSTEKLKTHTENAL